MDPVLDGLWVKDAETFAVLYYGVLAGQLNGSETFTEKRDYFYQQVRNVNNHHWLTTKVTKDFVQILLDY